MKNTKQNKNDGMEWGSGDQLESVQSGKASEIRGSNKMEQTRRNGVEWIIICVGDCRRLLDEEEQDIYR
jgi:hypothetical protein